MRLAELRPGWRTRLILHRHGARVAERGDCIVVCTPDDPTFCPGNCLLLPAGPLDGDMAHWRHRFHDETGRLRPECLHPAFGVNGPPAGQTSAR